MKRIPALFAVVFAVTLTSAFAQQQGSIDYRPVSCIRGGEMGVLQMTVKDKGTLRMYFRRTGASDWCSVDGTNAGPLSSVILPKFNDNDEIEYYFVVINGKQVVAKSPDVYKVKATPNCNTPVARHTTMIPMECLPTGGNPIAQSLGAGYSLRSSISEQPFSPERP